MKRSRNLRVLLLRFLYQLTQRHWRGTVVRQGSGKVAVKLAGKARVAASSADPAGKDLETGLGDERLDEADHQLPVGLSELGEVGQVVSEVVFR